jgi:hypothetical protein
MELTLSSEAASRSATQKFLNILWDPKGHYHLHKSPLMISVFSQMNPDQIIESHFSQIQPNCVFPPTPRYSYRSFSFLTFKLKPYMYLVSPHACCMLCLSHSHWLDHSNYTWRRVQVMKLLITQFSPTTCHSIPLLCKYSPQHAVLNTFSLC